MTLLSFAVLCPEAEIASGDAVMVTAPGSEGEFGILASHAPFATLLRAGCVIIEKSDGAKDYFFISAGFLRADGESVTILADEIEAATALDAQTLQQSIQDAKDDLANAPAPDRRNQAQHRLILLQAKLDVLSRAAL